MLRKAHRYLKSLWYGPEAEDSKPLLPAGSQNYLSIEEKKPPTNRELFEENKKIIVEEKGPFYETEQKLNRVHGWIGKGALVVMITNPICRFSYAYHAAEDAISNDIKNNVMPEWSQLTPYCLAGVEKELGVTSPEQCFHWVTWWTFSVPTADMLDKYRGEWECPYNIVTLYFRCHLDAPSFLEEFMGPLWLKAGKEELMVLALWLVCDLIMSYLKEKYSKKYLLNAEEAKKVDDFVTMEANASGNHFAVLNFNRPTSREQIVGMLDVIQWSYNEVDTYKQHMKDMQDYIIINTNLSADCAGVITGYHLDYLDAIRTQSAKHCETLPYGVITFENSGAWKTTYANFFKTIPFQNDVVVEVIAEHGSEEKPSL